MNNPKIVLESNMFNEWTHPRLGSFRSVYIPEISDDILFVGTDIVRCLGYSRTDNILSRYVSKENRYILTYREDGSNYKYKISIITREGLYELAIRSEAPRAKEFQKWLTSEVLPSIDRYGIYSEYTDIMDQVKDIASREKLEELIKSSVTERNRAIVAQAAAKDAIEFREVLTSSVGSCTIGTLAKSIADNGYHIGEKRMYKWLRDRGYLIKDGRDKNLPTQKSISLGYLEICHGTREENGCSHTFRVTMVTPKGKGFFIKEYIDEEMKRAMSDKSSIEYQYMMRNQEKASQGFTVLLPKKNGEFYKFLKEIHK